VVGAGAPPCGTSSRAFPAFFDGNFLQFWLIMVYQALARRYRPRDFSDFIGHEAVVSALVHAIEHERIHHAYIFSGSRGVGKTTIARIFARCLNCESGAVSQPCGQCPQCRQFDLGRHLDLVEVDAASRSRVEEMRELLDNVSYAPSMGRYKIYLIDEVHMLSIHAFNALLKTLEEPPGHVKFLLATTEIHKLPSTIVSRCLVFNLKRLPTRQIEQRLFDIVDREQLQADKEALRLMAQAADGSLRDALSLLDQVAGLATGVIRADDVHALLGSVNRQALVELLQYLNADDGVALLEAARRIHDAGADLARAMDHLAILLQKIAIVQVVPQAMDEDDAPWLRPLVGAWKPEDIQVFYQMLLIGKRELPLAPDPFSGFEMTLLRMLALHSGRWQMRHSSSEPVSQASLSVPTKPSAPVGKISEVAPSVKKSGPSAQSGQQSWEQVVPHMPAPVRELAKRCKLINVREHDEKKEVLLAVESQLSSLVHPASVLSLEQALATYWGVEDPARLKIKIEIADRLKNTLAQKEAHQHAEAHRLRRVEVLQDPVAKTLIRTFDAELDETSLRRQDSNIPKGE